MVIGAVDEWDREGNAIVCGGGKVSIEPLSPSLPCFYLSHHHYIPMFLLQCFHPNLIHPPHLIPLIISAQCPFPPSASRLLRVRSRSRWLYGSIRLTLRCTGNPPLSYPDTFQNISNKSIPTCGITASVYLVNFRRCCWWWCRLTGVVIFVSIIIVILVTVVVVVGGAKNHPEMFKAVESLLDSTEVENSADNDEEGEEVGELVFDSGKEGY